MVYSHLQDYFHKIYNETNRLIIYRSLLNDSIVKKMRGLLWHTSQEDTNSPKIETTMYVLSYLLIEQAEKHQFEGNVWQAYLLHLLATDENAFSRAAEKFGPEFPSGSLRDAAAHDVKILYDFANLSLKDFGKIGGIYEIPYLDNFQLTKTFSPTGNQHYQEQFSSLINTFTKETAPQELVNSLARFYNSVGCGQMGIYSAFRWIEDTGLSGIKHPDPITLEDLIGYEKQKEIVVNNTTAFARGRPANNLLLYGERGTGKSSTIKALANRFASQGLRLVEVAKHQLPSFPQIVDRLRGRAQRFIIFIDDLSFESYETEYKYLKAVLEGGIEVNPDNVLIYATSNRRHLVQENWGDREDQGGEIHILDSVQEKLSLADRFGITVTYTSPDQEQYLEIVEGLAHKHGIETPAEKLREMALRWERWHNVRSGRTAQQFINHLLGAQ